MQSQNEQNQIYFIIKIEKSIYSYDCNIIYSNPNIIDSDNQILNGIVINFNSKGETDIILSLKENTEISYTFKVVIV